MEKLTLHVSPNLINWVNSLSDEAAESICNREMEKHITALETIIRGWKTFDKTQNPRFLLFILRDPDTLKEYETKFLLPKMVKLEKEKQAAEEANRVRSTRLSLDDGDDSSDTGGSSESLSSKSKITPQTSTENAGSYLGPLPDDQVTPEIQETAERFIRLGEYINDSILAAAVQYAEINKQAATSSAIPTTAVTQSLATGTVVTSSISHCNDSNKSHVEMKQSKENAERAREMLEEVRLQAEASEQVARAQAISAEAVAMLNKMQQAKDLANARTQGRPNISFKDIPCNENEMTRYMEICKTGPQNDEDVALMDKVDKNKAAITSGLMGMLRSENYRLIENKNIIVEIGAVVKKNFDTPDKMTKEELMRCAQYICDESIIRWEESSKPQAGQYLQMYRCLKDHCTASVAQAICQYSRILPIERDDVEKTMLLQFQAGKLNLGPEIIDVTETE